jgi:hypothetical protein
MRNPTRICYLWCSTMTLDAIINLETIRHAQAGGGGYPYIWPIRVWMDSSGLFSNSLKVAPRHILGSGLSVGESADIPSSLGQLRIRFDESTTKRSLILVAALWSAKESPDNVINAGSDSFYDSFPGRLSDHIASLINWDALSEDERSHIINLIKTSVRNDVESAIRNSLSFSQKIQIALGTLTLDEFIEAVFVTFDVSVLKPPEASSSSVPITLRFKESYQIEGHLVITRVETRCQPQVDAVHSAESQIRSLRAQIRDLEQNPDNLPPRVVRDLIRKIRMEDLPQARDTLENAKRALQNCLSHLP